MPQGVEPTSAGDVSEAEGLGEGLPSSPAGVNTGSAGGDGDVSAPGNFPSQIGDRIAGFLQSIFDGIKDRFSFFQPDDTDSSSPEAVTDSSAEENDIDEVTNTSGQSESFLGPIDRPFDAQKLQEQTRTRLATNLLRTLNITLVVIGFSVIIPLEEIISSKLVQDSDETTIPETTTTQEPVIKLGENSYLVIYTKKGKKEDNNKDLITLIWTSQITLISGALGFYFGSKTG